MKKILILLMLIFPVSLMAQNGSYVLKGKVGNINTPAKVYLTHETTPGIFIDSSVIHNGQFELKGAITDPYAATLILSSAGSGLNGKYELFSFYLAPGVIDISSPDSFANATIKGSKVNADNEKLQTALTLNEKKLQSRHPVDKEMDSSDMAKYKIRLKLYNEAKMQVYLDFIRENPNSFISLDALKYIGGTMPDYSKISPLFNSLSSDIRNTITGKEYAGLLKSVKATSIGKIAPGFTLNDPDGKSVKLSDFKGKYVLVDFWASWCVPCRAENPNLVKAYTKYHEKGLEILSVSFDDEKNKAAWLNAIKKDGLLWKQVSDLKGWKNNPVAMLYGIKAIPQNVLLDKTGKIVGKNLRGEALNQKLGEIFN